LQKNVSNSTAILDFRYFDSPRANSGFTLKNDGA
jgi:hypothetical protein